jgi:hypothetical protein
MKASLWSYKSDLSPSILPPTFTPSITKLQRNKSKAMSRLKISVRKGFVNDGTGDFRGQMQLSREIATPMAHIKNRKYLRSDTIPVSLFRIATIPAIH